MKAVSANRARLATIVIGSVLMSISAAVFVMTVSTNSVADRSRRLHHLAEVQRLVEGEWSALATDTHFASLEDQLGWNLAAERSALEAEVSRAAADVESQVELLGTRIETVDRFLEGAAEIVELLGTDVPAAQEMLETVVQPAFVEAEADVEERRSEVLAEIAATDSRSARFGDIARFVVILLVPMAMVLVYREITERVLRQRQLEMQLEAEQALAQARDEFVANASHELRTPLTGILGLSEVLVEDDRIPGDAREMLSMVVTEAADLSRMVEDLLTTARLSAGQLRFEPRRVATTEEAETIVRPFRQAGTKVAIDVEDAAVFVDRLRQRQVLRNLVSNAVKYGGNRISLTGHRDGVTFKWIVADNGPGVPRELEERLFQRYIHTLTFQQAVAGGVGLGLSIVKSLTEGMGGTVEYARILGETCFIVRVPLADGAAGARPSIRAAGGVR